MKMGFFAYDGVFFAIDWCFSLTMGVPMDFPLKMGRSPKMFAENHGRDSVISAGRT